MIRDGDGIYGELVPKTLSADGIIGTDATCKEDAGTLAWSLWVENSVELANLEREDVS
jgi:hypothetical protein